MLRYCPKRTRNVVVAMVVAVSFVLMLLAGGCTRSVGISDDYGTLVSAESRSSVNGTTVFADAIQRQGNRIVVSRRITPKIERFGTIVWFAAKNSGAPEPEIVDRINKWLENDKSRKLVYVGWDADAAVDFWSDAVENGNRDNELSTIRRRANAMADADENAGLTGVTAAGCDWFQFGNGQREKLNRLVDESGRAIDTTSGTVTLGAVRLIPSPKAPTRSILRTDDGVPFAFSTASSQSVTRRNVFVVSNSSILLNYSLLNGTNRLLASRLLESVGTLEGPVMFLHSGPVDYSDAIYEKQTAWSWINQPPVRYIVPHILVIGLIFIFSVFPVLGRPRTVDAGLQPGLGRHVDAAAQLIVRSGKKAETELWIKSKMNSKPESQKRGSGGQTAR